MTPFFLVAQNKKLSLFFEAVKFKSSNLESKTYISKARLFFLEKQWDSTLLYAARHLDSNVSDTRMNDYAYFFKAYSLRKKKIFEQSEITFSKISKEYDFYERVFFYKGGIELELKRYDKAIANFEKALEAIQTEAMVGVRVSTIYNNLGICFLHLQQFEKADEYLLKNIETVEKRKDTSKMIGAYTNLANLYYSRMLDDKAILYFKKAYEIAQDVDGFDWKRRVAKNMAVVEENRKDFTKALAYRKEYEQWKDSLNNQNRIYETAQLEKKIAVQQKQGEVNLLQVENSAKERQRNIFLISATLLLLLLIATYYFYREKVKINKIVSAQKEELNTLNAAKDKLFSIVSHDLRSSVNAIKTSNKRLLSNLESEHTKDLKETLQKNSSIVNGAYGLLDNLLNWALLQTKQSYFEIIPLQLNRIVEHVAYNYKSMMKEKDITFENIVDKKHIVLVDQGSLKIILRNLLDNAIKFSNTAGRIQIYSQEQDMYYVLIVEDSGIGIDQLTIDELLKETQLLSKKKNEDVLGTGLGLHLVKSMVEKNNGKLTIESEIGKGTRMIVSLPKES